MRIKFEIDGKGKKCHGHGRTQEVRLEIALASAIQAMANKQALIDKGRGRNGKSMSPALIVRHQRMALMATPA